ncbi:hypothetical protein A9Q82_02145 [Cycloclasticus sp. 46_120_T64]|nr:hypothetical protein A9Q82_02145 [Cycloclasticus sp. 46_120_T64]
MEPRSYLRSPLKLPVKLTFKDKEIHCTSRDFSLGGMYLEADDAFVSLGAETIISFSLQQSNGNKWHSINARVAHTKADGIGISFLQVNKAIFRTLQELLKFTRQQNIH